MFAIAGSRSDSPARDATILILDKKTQAMPWECIPILFDLPVCRAPSIHYVIARAAQFSKSADRNCIRDGVDDSRCFYLLNPSGDLLKSQALLEPYFKAMKWKGHAGSSPMSTWLQDHLQSNDLFVYVMRSPPKNLLNFLLDIAAITLASFTSVPILSRP